MLGMTLGVKSGMTEGVMSGMTLGPFRQSCRRPSVNPAGLFLSFPPVVSGNPVVPLFN